MLSARACRWLRSTLLSDLPQHPWLIPLLLSPWLRAALRPAHLSVWVLNIKGQPRCGAQKKWPCLTNGLPIRFGSKGFSLLDSNNLSSHIGSVRSNPHLTNTLMNILSKVNSLTWQQTVLECLYEQRRHFKVWDNQSKLYICLNMIGWY